MTRYELIYTDPSFDKDANNYLANYGHYWQLEFERLDCEMVYLNEEILKQELPYFFPQLSAEQIAATIRKHNPSQPGYNQPQLLLRKQGSQQIDEIFLLPDTHDKESLDTAFEMLKGLLSKKTTEAKNIQKTIMPASETIQRTISNESCLAERTRGFRRKSRNNEIYGNVVTRMVCHTFADDLDESDTQEPETPQLDPEMLEHLERLQQLGMTRQMLMHYFSLEKPEVSRLVITHDYRIILTDYQEREVKMTTLPKVLYFLYLKHPEGIPFKRLIDYRDELIDIYHHLSNRENTEKMEQSINALVNPINNSVNEKVSLIRAAFTQQIDPTLAEPYIITTEAHLLKKVTLDRSMLIDESQLITVHC